ncbi:MAG TPA: hypothetical protein VK871_11935, partial [Candidatus Limnocylindrales bacterium]|nr:hypothetical protein [Candidatus Limnocylindrales bacterium]
MRPDRSRGTHGSRRGVPGRADDRCPVGGMSPTAGTDGGTSGFVAGPVDPELETLAAELARAGDAARRRERTTRPDPAFAAELRARLLAGIPASGGPALAGAGSATP